MRTDLYADLTPWQRVKMARLKERPTTLDYIKLISEDFIEFHGDRLFAEDKAIVGGIGTIGQQVFTIIGHQKGKDTKRQSKTQLWYATSRRLPKSPSFNETS